MGKVFKEIKCTINKEEITCNIEYGASLQDMLRENGYTSVKQGCGVGECGACTVLVNNTPIDSCIYLAVWADRKTIRTAEGEAKGLKLSPVQQSYVDNGAIQCGFCTPGFIMTSTAFVEKNKGEKINRNLIRKEHAGNLCRCTGYEAIIEAVEQTTEK